MSIIVGDKFIYTRGFGCRMDFNMKTNISILLSCVLLALSSCTYSAFEEIDKEEVQDDVVEVEDTVDKEIVFSTVLAVPSSTKAPVMTLDLLKDAEGGFGVNAVYTPGLWSEAGSTYPDVMYNQRVTWNGEKWSYDPVKYWPTLKGERVSFFAWAPYGDPCIDICDATSADADPTRLHFTMAERSNETIDFIAASAIDNSESNPNSTVTFVFRHELVRLEMYAKVDENLYRDDDAANKTRVIVKSARLVGLNFYTEADYLYNTEVEDGHGAWDFDGFNISDGYPVEICGDSVRLDTRVPYVAADAIVLSQMDVERLLLEESNTDPSERYIYIIPPRGVEGAYMGDVGVEFQYDIVTEDDQLAAGYACTSATKVVDFPTGTLKQGYSYKYTFTFCLNQIKLDATVVYSDEKEEEVGV